MKVICKNNEDYSDYFDIDEIYDIIYLDDDEICRVFSTKVNSYFYFYLDGFCWAENYYSNLFSKHFYTLQESRKLKILKFLENEV